MIIGIIPTNKEELINEIDMGAFKCEDDLFEFCYENKKILDIDMTCDLINYYKCNKVIIQLKNQISKNTYNVSKKQITEWFYNCHIENEYNKKYLENELNKLFEFKLKVIKIRQDKLKEFYKDVNNQIKNNK